MVRRPKSEALTPSRPAVVEPVRELRAAVLSASLELVRGRGLEARYFRGLPARHVETVRHAASTSWVAVDAAVAHYWVLDDLFPSPVQQIENGRHASDRTQGAYLQTLLRLARSTGQVDPMQGLRKLPSALGRMWNGGGAPTAWLTGPKDARIELWGYPICDVPYVKNAWQGMLESALSLTARRVFVALDAAFAEPSAVAYDVTWV